MSGSQNTHAFAAPSDFRRWSTCAGALTLQAALDDVLQPEESSDAAVEGTRLHDLAEAVLRSELTIWDLDDSDFEKIGGYITHCQSHRGSTSIEKRVPLFYSPTETGTVDFSAVHGDMLTIVDLKTGVVPVAADGNMQLLIYAMGIITDDIKTVTMQISQHDEIKSWTISADHLRAIAADVKDLAIAAMDETNTATTPSDDTCRYCKAKAYCKSYTEPLIAMFDYVVAAPPLERMTDAKLVQIFSQSADIKKLLTAVESTLYGRVIHGDDIEGLHLAHGRKSARAWAKGVDPLRAMIDAGINPSEAVTSKPITPTQALKLSQDVTGWYQAEGKPKLTAGNAENPVDYFEEI